MMHHSRYDSSGWVVISSQRPLLDNTHNTHNRTNIHAPGGIRTHNLSRQAATAYTLDCAVTVTGVNSVRMIKSRRMTSTGHKACMRGKRCIQTFGQKMRRNMHKHVWENHIKMDPKEIRWQGVNWINLAEDSDLWQTLVNTEINVGFYKTAGIFLTVWAPVSLQRSIVSHGVNHSTIS